MKTRLKDYYRTLEVSPGASLDDIRKSFRKLAFRYHPDKNEGNTFSAAQFIEIKEAWYVLSDADRRYRYDEERWLLGMSKRAGAASETNAAWLRGEAGKLRRHMAQIDAYRMNHDALQQYILQLLSDAHIAILTNEPAMASAVTEDVVASIGKMKARLMPAVLQRLKLLCGQNEVIHGRMDHLLQVSIDKEKKETYFPLWVMLVIVVLMIIAAAVLSV